MLGKYTAKTIKFLKLKETKSSWLVATWTIETYLLIILLYISILTGSTIFPLAMIAFYVYGSYSLFSIIND